MNDEHMQEATSVTERAFVFAKGDVVYLKSGSPGMTISMVDAVEFEYKVEFWNGEKFTFAFFDGELLTDQRPNW